jgi:hypothetical protein
MVDTVADFLSRGFGETQLTAAMARQRNGSSPALCYRFHANDQSSVERGCALAFRPQRFLAKPIYQLIHIQADGDHARHRHPLNIIGAKLLPHRHTMRRAMPENDCHHCTSISLRARKADATG